MPKQEIRPELKEFLDQILIPMLVRDAVRTICEENALAARVASNAECRTEGENG